MIAAICLLRCPDLLLRGLLYQRVGGAPGQTYSTGKKRNHL
jgi:hypothetical protein